MSSKPTILRSGVGRRIFLLYLLSALIPILTLAFVSYRSVTGHLVDQSDQRLHRLTKAYAMEIWERLSFLDTELQIVSAELRLQRTAPLPTLLDVLGEDLSRRFLGVTWVRPDRSNSRIHGSDRRTPEVDAEGDRHLADGRSLLLISDTDQREIEVWLARRVAPSYPALGTVWGKLDPTYVWWGATFATTLPPMYTMSVMDLESDRIIYSTLSPDTADSQVNYVDTSRGSQGEFDWNNDGEVHRARYRSVNLRPVFLHRGLTLVVTQPKKAMLLPLSDFRRTFIGVVLLSLWAVVLLGVRSIRSSLTPLGILREGTRKVASGDLATQLEIDTGDEFQQLGQSFNSMAQSLTRQFSTLSTLNSLQQAILSSLQTEEILAPALEGFSDVFPCQEVNISVINSNRAGDGRRFSLRVESATTMDSEPIVLTALEVVKLRANPTIYHLDTNSWSVSYFRAQQTTRVDRLTVWPGFINGKLAVVVAAGFTGGQNHSDEDFDRARQLVDQVTVALSNSRLIQELDDLSVGTLTALARAIDIRSHWTMGHTDRVAEMTRRIGTAMGLPQKRLRTLHQGSLLHDIGKIGTPSSILDKLTRLSPAEMLQIQEHVRLGVQILEPIAELQDARRVVLEHHEWYDGNGYPEGISGEQICLEARIVAVVDCYDALQSARPYRPAIGQQETLDYIREGAGTHFDPEVVEAFFRVGAPDMSTQADPSRQHGTPVQRDTPRQDYSAAHHSEN